MRHDRIFGSRVAHEGQDAACMPPEQWHAKTFLDRFPRANSAEATACAHMNSPPAVRVSQKDRASAPVKAAQKRTPVKVRKPALPTLRRLVPRFPARLCRPFPMLSRRTIERLIPRGFLDRVFRRTFDLRFLGF